MEKERRKGEKRYRRKCRKESMDEGKERINDRERRKRRKSYRRKCRKENMNEGKERVYGGSKE